MCVCVWIYIHRQWCRLFFLCVSVLRTWVAHFKQSLCSLGTTTDLYEVPDAVPPIHAVSSHVATDKDPSK